MKTRTNFVLSFMLIIVLVFFIAVLKNINFSSVGVGIDTEESLNKPVLITGLDTISLEVVRTNRDRSRGLSGRSFLDSKEGMIFVFPTSGIYGFWMKDMNFPIDIAWIDSDFKIIHMEENISPETYPKKFKSTLPADYVVEVVSGFFKGHKIKAGDSLIIRNVL